MRHFLCLFLYWHFPSRPTSVGTYRLREVKQKPEKLNQKEIVHSPHTLDGRVRVLKRAPTRCYFAYCSFTGNLEHHKTNWSRSAIEKTNHYLPKVHVALKKCSSSMTWFLMIPGLAFPSGSIFTSNHREVIQKPEKFYQCDILNNPQILDGWNL